MLSDKIVSTKKRPNRPVKAAEKRWGDDQKIEAVQAFVALGGNVSATATALRVPRPTIQRWMKTQWWQDLYLEIKQETNFVLSHRLEKIVARSMDLVEDRLEKGDFFYDQKTGKIIRKEVSLRDAHDVMQSSFKMKDMLEKPQVVQLEESSISEKLNQLAQQFESFASAQKEKPKVTVTDVMFVEEKKDGM